MKGLFIVTALITLASCSTQGSPTPSAASDAVAIAGFLFKPTALTVDVGAAVTWRNDDSILHTVTAGTPDDRTKLFDMRLDGSGATATRTFSTAGTFPYFCSRHEHMRGSITVKG